MSIFDDIAELEERIEQECTTVYASELGLDSRCGPILVGPDYIATRNRRALDYYGGFEYVDPAYVTPVGTLTLYHEEDDRVYSHMHWGEEEAE